MSDAPLPLSNIIVLDLTLARAGPTAVRHLADWGADVIRIEPPAAGRADLTGARLDADYQNLHRNKRMVTLDLKSDDGHAAFMRLVERADVILENMRVQVTHRLKIAWEDVHPINPRLVYGSISGFGQDGPYANRPGFDQIAQGMGGLMSITGMPGRGPLRVGIPVADLSAGIFASVGILVALLEREKSKKGQHVMTSLLQAQIFMLDFQAARYLVQGEVAKQAGNNHPTSIPTGVFKTKDGYINIAATGAKIWQRFCEAIEAPAIAQNPNYQSGASRSANRDALNAEIGSYLIGRTSAEWIDRLNQAGVPCGPIYAIDQMFADPQVQHLRMAQTVTKRDKSKMGLVAQPVTLSRTPSRFVAPPPELGEHTDSVLKEFGFKPKEIAALHKANAV